MRRIDHIVVAVQDLSRAGELYQRLGFQVGSVNRHPWGTENRLIQFGTSFIELITVPSNAGQIPAHEYRHFSFGAFVRDFLQEREGIAMLVLSSTNAEADAKCFAEQGIGDFEPFHFSRTGTRPDGSRAEVAFSLAFATEPAAPDTGFFVCQQHNPENFWSPAFQRHANSATNLDCVTLTSREPERLASFLAKFTGEGGEHSPDGGLRLALGNGRLEMFRAHSSKSTAERPALFSSCQVRVENLASMESILVAEAIPFARLKEQIAISPGFLHGVELRFGISSASPDAA